MSIKEKKNIFGKNLSFAIIIFAIFSLIYLFVYWNNNKLDQKILGDETQNQEEESKIISEDSKNELTEERGNFTELASRKIELFKDANHNKIWDAGEDICDICIGKYLNGAYLEEGKIFPQSSTFITMGVQPGAILSANELEGINTIWGYSSDRELIIPQTELFLGDNVNDVSIPVWETSSIINGVNSMMSEGEELNSEIKGNYEVVYLFPNLVPSVSDMVNGNDLIYVYYIPDPNNLDVGYLVSGKIIKDTSFIYSDVIDSYYLKINWPFTEVDENVLDKENLTFVIL